MHGRSIPPYIHSNALFFWADIAIVLESSRRWMCGGRCGCWPHILSDRLVPDELDEEVVKRAAAAALEDVRLVRTSRRWAAGGDSFLPLTESKKEQIWHPLENFSLCPTSVNGLLEPVPTCIQADDREEVRAAAKSASKSPCRRQFEEKRMGNRKKAGWNQAPRKNSVDRDSSVAEFQFY